MIFKRIIQTLLGKTSCIIAGFPSIQVVIISGATQAQLLATIINWLRQHMRIRTI